MTSKLRRLALVVVAAALAAAGCGQPILKPVGDAGTAAWGKVITMPVLKARFKLTSGKKLFRDDGLYLGDLSIHTHEMEREFPGRKVTTFGRGAEGLATAVTRADGVRCLAIYGLSTGNAARDGGRREGLRAAAVIKLGMRRELETHLAKLGIRLQFRTMTDEDLANLVEVYSLAKLGYQMDRVINVDKRKFIPMLQACGAIKEPPGPTGRW